MFRAPRPRPARVSVARRGRAARRAFRALLRAPRGIRLVAVAGVAVAIWLASNLAYQVARKPTELFFPVASVLTKAPAETWRQYGPLFRQHSTAVMTPELLAALAQIEGAGNPVARTYWRWRLAANPLEWYRPASSAVGMYQITDATFETAKRYCIRDHVAVEDGPRGDGRSCWLNRFYTRVLPSHAIEMTSALLDRSVADTLARGRIRAAPLAQRQDLAAIIHLCGAGEGDTYARRGFRLAPGQQCGDHSAERYLAQVNAMKRQFARLARAS